MENVPLSMYFIVVWEIFELGYMCGICTIIDINVSRNSRKKLFLLSFVPFSQNDRFYFDLVTLNWYLLPRDCKRNLIILLDCAKKANNFKVADMLPLNMNTYIMVGTDRIPVGYCFFHARYLSF